MTVPAGTEAGGGRAASPRPAWLSRAPATALVAPAPASARRKAAGMWDNRLICTPQGVPRRGVTNACLTGGAVLSKLVRISRRLRAAFGWRGFGRGRGRPGRAVITPSVRVLTEGIYASFRRP